MKTVEKGCEMIETLAELDIMNMHRENEALKAHLAEEQVKVKELREQYLRDGCIANQLRIQLAMAHSEVAVLKHDVTKKDQEIAAMMKKYDALSDAYRTANIQRIKWFKKWAELVDLPEDEEEERLNNGI